MKIKWSGLSKTGGRTNENKMEQRVKEVRRQEIKGRNENKDFVINWFVVLWNSSDKFELAMSL